MIHIITIDGPASSGKGSVAKIIANQLNLHYLDSGALYRIVAIIALKHNLIQDNTLLDGQLSHLLRLIEQATIIFQHNKVYMDQIDYTDLIRQEHVGMLSSYLSNIAKVREKLLLIQHQYAVAPGLVTDGRDMGSVVFPQASLKIFLTAQDQVRAQRRFEQLQKLGQSATIETILRDIQMRDNADKSRQISPLTFDNSFKIIDNTHMTLPETVTQIIDYAHELSLFKG